MTKIKVLIVDDEEIVVLGIKKSLALSGFEVDTVIDGLNAITLCKSKFYDVVLVDLIMPGLNGVSTCEGIKNVSPKTEVLLISGYPNSVTKFHSAFLKVGGKDKYLRKPLLGREIVGAIEELVYK